MTKIFLIENTGVKVVHYHWFCDKCDKVTVREEASRGDFSDREYWPAHNPTSKRCPECGNFAGFISANLNVIWQRVDNGEEITNVLDHPGACYYEENGAWDTKHRVQRFGEDGKAIVVVLPNRMRWYLDARASNCTKMDDHEHRCWVRHGSVEEGNLHVDKNGLTCAAGAGSIKFDDYHGFLHNGELIPC